MAPNEGPYFQFGPRGRRTRRRSRRCGTAVRWTPAPAPGPRSTSAPRQRAAAGDPTPGYDGHCRDWAAPGGGRALRFRTRTRAGPGARPRARRGGVPQAGAEDFICVKGNGKPLFVLANVVDDRTMAITHVIRGEDQLPNTPKQIMLWGALNGAEGGGPALPAFAHLPLLVNEQGKKLSKRRDPVAVEMYREQGYLPTAFRNYLALLGWSPGEEEIVPLGDDDRAVPARGRAAVAGLLRRAEAVAHERRLHPRAADEGVHRAAAALGGPGPGEWAPGAGATPTPARRRRAAILGGRTLRRRCLRRLAPVMQERVAVLGEVPELVDFFFLEEPPDDPDSWQKAIAGDEGAPHSGRSPGGLRDLPVGQATRCTRPRWPSRRRTAASWARPRRRSGWP